MQEQNTKKTKINQYIINSKLGSGFNSIVRIGTDSNSGEKYAIKFLRDNNDLQTGLRILEHEFKVLQSLDHLNIVKVKELQLNGNFESAEGSKSKLPFLAMKIAENGMLIRYLIKTGNFEEKLARFYFKQLVSALDHCHNKGYAHRNLKPECLLLDSDFNLILSKFNISAQLLDKDGSQRLRLLSGSQNYMAPELHLKSTHLGISVDVFGLGVLLFVMVVGKPPFTRAAKNDSYYSLICTNNYRKFWKAHSSNLNSPTKKFSEEFQLLVFALLSVEPTQRLSIAEVKSHPWFKEEQLSDEKVLKEMKRRKSILEISEEKERKVALNRRRINRMRRRRQGGKNNYGYEGIVPTFRGGTEFEESMIESNNIPQFSNLQASFKAGNYEYNELGHNLVSFLDPKSLYKAAGIAVENLTRQVVYKPEEATVKKNLTRLKLSF